MKKIILLLVSFVNLLSCTCPYEEFNEDRRERYGYNSSRNERNDRFYADMLLGTWQCYYPMIINGMGELVGDQPNIRYEMKEIEFINHSTCDISLQPVGSIDKRVYTFSYLYDGNALRFTKNHKTIILTLTGFLYPELYLRDSFGKYTMAKRKAYGC
jgi:hypothetical protein